MLQRIFHVIYSFQVGGSEMVVRDLVESLPDFAHGVAALEGGGLLENELRDRGTPTWNIARENRGLLNPIRKLWSAMGRFQPDIVHTHHLHELVYALPAAKLRFRPIVHTEHEYFSLQVGRAGALLQRLSNLCAAVTAVNQETADYLKGRLGLPDEKVRTIVNGVDVQRFGSTLADRSALGLTGDEVVIGSVARLDPVKNHALLVSAFAKVLLSHPRAVLLLVGDGQERARLERLCGSLNVGEKVRFLGARRDIPQLLAAMDVFALASTAEGLPLSLLEAMAARKAIVSTNVGGVPAVVRNDETGFLVESRNEDELTAAMGRLVESEDLRDRLGRNAQRLVMERYSLENSADQYRKLYREVLNARPRAKSFP